MGIRCNQRAARRNSRPAAGFSLMELIVAMAVISAAGTLFISLYMSSLDLAQTARNRSVATQLAEEQVSAILGAPGNFLWAFPEEASVDPFAIQLTEEDPPAGNLFEPPAAMPAEESAHNREESVYGKFRWQASARLPNVNSTYYEITVVVRWKEAGRQQLLALTSALPRFQVAAAFAEEGS